LNDPEAFDRETRKLQASFLQAPEPNFANPRMNDALKAGRELSLKMLKERRRKEKENEKREKAGEVLDAEEVLGMSSSFSLADVEQIAQKYRSKTDLGDREWLDDRTLKLKISTTVQNTLVTRK
jgi:hypothetical protein